MARSAQNSGKPKGKKRGDPLKKGADPRRNKGGRPKGLMQYVRAQTKDGKELANFALDVLRGKPVEALLGNEKIKVSAGLQHRIEALKWLGDRGFGKPIQEIQTGGATITGIVVLPAEDPNG